MAKDLDSRILGILKSSGKLKRKEELDRLIKERADELDLVGRGLKKLGNAKLEDISPIRADGFEYGEEIPCYISMDKENCIRSSNFYSSVFYFGKVQLYIYSYLLSFSGEYREEKLTEIYYKDISGFMTESKYMQKTDMGKRKFEMPVRSLCILTKGDRISFPLNVEPNEKADQIISALKSVVQTKIFK